jgi:hypothetical protein
MFLVLTRIPTHPATASVTRMAILARPDPLDVWITSRNGAAKANLSPAVGVAIAVCSNARGARQPCVDAIYGRPC